LLENFRSDWTPNEAGLLFANRGAPYWSSNVRRYHFHPLLERLGIPRGGLHAFRHGHATNLFASGVSAPTVKGMLRHGDIKVTLGYTHMASSEQRAAAESASALLHKPKAEA
jgi:site-specific recombinase XerD